MHLLWAPGLRVPCRPGSVITCRASARVITTRIEEEKGDAYIFAFRREALDAFNEADAAMRLRAEELTLTAIARCLSCRFPETAQNHSATVPKGSKCRFSSVAVDWLPYRNT